MSLVCSVTYIGSPSTLFFEMYSVSGQYVFLRFLDLDVRPECFRRLLAGVHGNLLIFFVVIFYFCLFCNIPSSGPGKLSM